MPDPRPRDTPGRDHGKPRGLEEERALARWDLGEPLTPAFAGMKCAG